jgi:hypothetical protein
MVPLQLIRTTNYQRDKKNLLMRENTLWNLFLSDCKTFWEEVAIIKKIILLHSVCISIQRKLLKFSDTLKLASYSQHFIFFVTYNKLEYYNTLGWTDLSWTNTLSLGAEIGDHFSLLISRPTPYRSTREVTKIYRESADFT